MTFDIIPIPVYKRVYSVPTYELSQVLSSKKKEKGLSSVALSQTLDVPLTKVEHWFRTDKYFAIPDAEIWMQLKETLDINTDIYDVCIMSFELCPGKYDMSERVYRTNGVSPTIRCDGNINIWS